LAIRERFGLQFFVATARPLAEPEELIAQVGRGQIPATVVSDNLARAAMTYLDGVRLGLELGSQMPVSWAVRQNSHQLRAGLNEFLKSHFWVTAQGQRRSQTYGILYERYYRDARQIRWFQEAEDRPDKSGRISPFDEWIQTQAAAAGLDWRLIAALIYQESRFRPEAISSAGAVGLMQVLPHIAPPDAENLFDPETNIRVGVRLLQEYHQSYTYLDSLDRWRFTLATYHAGPGHMADARRLAIDMGRNPNRWEGSVEVTLPRLMEGRFFSQTRHGFYRGVETVQYVQEILQRYRMYRRLVPHRPKPAPTLQDPVASPPPPP
jgi:membrane-bound lytic murein transglycosylase F